jgi:cytochrome c oxidase subunit 2
MFPLDDVNLKRWLRNPPEEKPGSKMPDLDLTEAEIEDLIAYLKTLK